MFQYCNTVEECSKLYAQLEREFNPDFSKENNWKINSLLFAYEERIDEIENKAFQDRNQYYMEISAEYSDTQEDIYSYDPRVSILFKIIFFGRVRRNFNLEFPLSIHSYFHKRKYITYAQYKSLLKIYQGWFMEEFLEKYIEAHKDEYKASKLQLRNSD